MLRSWESQINGRTAQGRVIHWDELHEEVSIQRLERRSLVEQQSPGRKVHVVGVPSLGSVKQVIACVEWTSQGGVVCRIEFIDRVEGRVGNSRRINQEITNEGVESCILLARWSVEVSYR